MHNGFTLNIWISERGLFSARPEPSDALKDWTKKLSRSVSFDKMREELKTEYGILIPAKPESIDFRPTLFGMQKATLLFAGDVDSENL